MFNPEGTMFPKKSSEGPRIFMPEEIKQMTDRRAKAEEAVKMLVNDFNLTEDEIENALKVAKDNNDTRIYS